MASWPPCDELIALLKRAAPVPEGIGSARRQQHALGLNWQTLLANVIHTSLPLQPPPGYRKRLARTAVRDAEHESPAGTISDELADELVQAVVPPCAQNEDSFEAESVSSSPSSDNDSASSSGAELSVRHFCYGLESCTDVHVLCSTNLLLDGTGSCLWDAGQVLSEILLSRPELVEGKEVLELGGGLGLVGVCAWRAGPPASLTVTDANSGAIENARYNMRQNGVPVREDDDLCAHGVNVKQLRWEDVTSELRSGIELVLASDVLYDRKAIPALARAIAQFLQAVPSSLAIVSSAVRSEETLQAFSHALANDELKMSDCTSYLWPTYAGRFHHIKEGSGERDITRIFCVRSMR